MKYLMPVHLCKHLKACGVNTTTTKNNNNCEKYYETIKKTQLYQWMKNRGNFCILNVKTALSFCKCKRFWFV